MNVSIRRPNQSLVAASPSVRLAKRLLAPLAAALFLLAAPGARADVLNYVLYDTATFGGIGTYTANGTFSYDNTTGTTLSANITLSGPAPSGLYDLSPRSSLTTDLTANDSAGDIVAFYFTTPLGGASSDIYYERIYPAGGGTYSTSDATGTVVAETVPEPSSLVLAAGAVAILGMRWGSRRRTAAVAAMNPA